MLKEKDNLCLKLSKQCEKIIFNKEATENIVKYLNDTFNIPTGLSMDLIAGRINLVDCSEYILFTLSNAIDVNLKQNIVNGYFTELEIKEYSSTKYKTETIKFPIIIPCEQVSADQWIGVADVNFFIKLRKAQMINYNVNAQRTMRKKIRGESIIYQIALNTGAIKAISNLMKRKLYIPNTITLNIADDIDAKYYYDKDKRELVIEKLNHFDISDGYHRYISMCQLKDADPDFNIPMELRLIAFDDNKVRQFIYQEDQKTKMRKIDSESMNMDAPANIIVERINNDPMFNLRGKISRNNGNINQSDFAEVIKYFYLSGKNITSSSNREIISIQKDIVEKMNYLTESNLEYLDKVFNKKELAILGKCFTKEYETIKEMVDEIEYMFSKQDELNNKAFYSIRKTTINELKKIER